LIRLQVEIVETSFLIGYDGFYSYRVLGC